MRPKVQEKFEKLETLFLETRPYNIEAVMLKEEVEELLESLTEGDYCEVCGGGLALSRHND